MAWAMQMRLARARRLLRDGRTPAHVAAELGFADQSHLNRFFKRVVASRQPASHALWASSRSIPFKTPGIPYRHRRPRSF
jgi:transcriptional regulator GlxA family with amidase domain